MIKAKAVSDVVYLGEEGEGTIGSWSESSLGRASWVAALINRAITATVQDARAEAELLRAENDRLRAALKPFAEYAAKVSDGWPDSTDVSTDNKPTVTLGDCRRAKEALEAKS